MVYGVVAGTRTTSKEVESVYEIPKGEFSRKVVGGFDVENVGVIEALSKWKDEETLYCGT